MSCPLELGCAQNLDRSLKEAHEIEWQHSHSLSPVNLSSALEPTYGKTPKQHTQVWHNPVQQTRPKRQRNQLKLEDKLEIIEFSEGEGKGLSQKAIAAHFHSQFPGLSQTAVGDAICDKALICSALNPTPSSKGPKVTIAPTTCHIQAASYPQVESILAKWQLQQEVMGQAVTGPVLIEKAHCIATELGVAFVGSNGWLQRFKGWYGICQHHFHGQAWSVNENDVSAACK